MVSSLYNEKRFAVFMWHQLKLSINVLLTDLQPAEFVLNHGHAMKGTTSQLSGIVCICLICLVLIIYVMFNLCPIYICCYLFNLSGSLNVDAWLLIHDIQSDHWEKNRGLNIDLMGSIKLQQKTWLRAISSQA